MSLPDTNYILYILPIPKFFSQANGVGGHVAHAYGIVNGFVQLGYELDIIAEEAHPTIENGKTRLHIKPIGKSSFLKRQLWGLGLIRLVKRIAQERQPLFCYVRYSVGFTPLLPLLKRVLGDIPLVLEVNSFGTQHYRFLRAMDFVALRSADVIICVSETVRNLMLKKVSSGLSSKILVNRKGIYSMLESSADYRGKVMERKRAVTWESQKMTIGSIVGWGVGGLP